MRGQLPMKWTLDPTKERTEMRTWIVKTSAIAALLALLASGNTCTEAAEAYSWKAAATSTVITPDAPVWMAGYSSRNRPSVDATQALYAKVLAVEDKAGSRLVIVTTDLVGITEPMRKAVQQQVLDRFGLTPAALLMNASHTHSGPEVRIDRLRLEERENGWIERAERYVQNTTDRIVTAIGQALATLEPARLELHVSARCGFAMNRRLVTTSGVRGQQNAGGHRAGHSVTPCCSIDSSWTASSYMRLQGSACALTKEYRDLEDCTI